MAKEVRTLQAFIDFFGNAETMYLYTSNSIHINKPKEIEVDRAKYNGDIQSKYSHFLKREIEMVEYFDGQIHIHLLEED